MKTISISPNAIPRPLRRARRGNQVGLERGDGLQPGLDGRTRHVGAKRNSKRSVSRSRQLAEPSPACFSRSRKAWAMDVNAEMMRIFMAILGVARRGLTD